MAENTKRPAIRFTGFTEALPASRQVGNSWYTYVLKSFLEKRGEEDGK